LRAIGATTLNDSGNTMRKTLRWSAGSRSVWWGRADRGKIPSPSFVMKEKSDANHCWRIKGRSAIGGQRRGLRDTLQTGFFRTGIDLVISGFVRWRSRIDFDADGDRQLDRRATQLDSSGRR